MQGVNPAVLVIELVFLLSYTVKFVAFELVRISFAILGVSICPQGLFGHHFTKLGFLILTV